MENEMNVMEEQNVKTGFNPVVGVFAGGIAAGFLGVTAYKFLVKPYLAKKKAKDVPPVFNIDDIPKDTVKVEE